MGEESLQRFIVTLLLPLMERYLADRGIKAFVGADLFLDCLAVATTSPPPTTMTQQVPVLRWHLLPMAV